MTGRVGINLLQRAVFVLDGQELPERADAAIGALALSIIAIAKTSPGDVADQVEATARLMRG